MALKNWERGFTKDIWLNKRRHSQRDQVLSVHHAYDGKAGNEQFGRDWLIPSYRDRSFVVVDKLNVGSKNRGEQVVVFKTAPAYNPKTIPQAKRQATLFAKSYMRRN